MGQSLSTGQSLRTGASVSRAQAQDAPALEPQIIHPVPGSQLKHENSTSLPVPAQEREGRTPARWHRWTPSRLHRKHRIPAHYAHQHAGSPEEAVPKPSRVRKVASCVFRGSFQCSALTSRKWSICSSVRCIDIVASARTHRFDRPENSACKTRSSRVSAQQI